MSDARYSSRTSPPARTSSLADIVHKTETHPTLSHHHPTIRPRTAGVDSDDGSQQERNHQQPRHPLSNLPRLPLPQDVSRTARHTAGDTSPKHPFRKRKNSNGLGGAPPDLSSLTQKPEDHASSIAQRFPAPDRPTLTSPAVIDERGLDKFQQTTGAEGSTEVNPVRSSAVGNPDESPVKAHGRCSLKEPPLRTELLEENRALRIELETLKYRLRKSEVLCHKQKKDLRLRDASLAKYRAQLVRLFEAGDGDLFQVNKAKYSAEFPQSVPSPILRDDANSKVDGESISNSQEEEWSTYSGPSMSLGYEQEKSEDRRRGEKDPYARSEATIRKHRRTRAPAWTPEEEIVFMHAYNKHGCRWKQFQDVLPGRSRRQIQSHGSYLIRQGKLLKKNSRPWQRRKPREGLAGSSVKDVEVDMEDAERSDPE